MDKQQIDLRAGEAVTTELSDEQLSNVSGGKAKASHPVQYLEFKLKDVIITSVT